MKTRLSDADEADLEPPQRLSRSTSAEAFQKISTELFVSGDINVLALVKGEERYVVLFDDDKRGEALRTLGRYASNPELSFSWYDAAVLSQKVRNLSKTSNEEESASGRFEVPAVEDFHDID